MTTFLLWVLISAICAVAFWIGHLVKGLNDRFGQLEHKLDVIIDQTSDGEGGR